MANFKGIKNAEELIRIFRKHGGTFENMALDFNYERGFFCRTLDSTKDSTVSCPHNLLIDIEDVDINVDGLFIKNPNKYGKNMEFIEKYFAFHFNKDLVKIFIDKKYQIQSLSTEEINIISRVLPPYMYRLDELDKLEYAKSQIIKSHGIRFSEERSVLMPFVTFLNHSKNGSPYNVSKDSITVTGKFRDEVFAIYNINDTLMIAGSYGFITDSNTILSVPVSHILPNGKSINIKRDLNEFIMNSKGRMIPVMHKKNDVITISWFPLHSEGAPLYPARIARMIAAEVNLAAEIILQIIYQLNLYALVPASLQLRNSNNPYARFIASAAKKQLELICGISE